MAGLRNPAGRVKVRAAHVQRPLVWARSGGRCERCGNGLPVVWECHHRKLRSQGGDWSLSNLLALHMDCHNAGSPTGVHAHPADAYRNGYLVRSAFDPAAAPLLLHGRNWVLLTPDGAYQPTEAPNA